jgi:hypothetical protein
LESLHRTQTRTQQTYFTGTASSISTIGIQFDDKTHVISGYLVGSPACNSKKIFKGDTIMTVDGLDSFKGDLYVLLKGTDKPDSVVTLGLKRVSGIVEEVQLRRMANSKLAHKRDMFDFFTNLSNRAKMDKDEVAAGYVQKSFDLWTEEMLEQTEHDDRVKNDLHKMQDACSTWFQELLQILEGLGSSGAGDGDDEVVVIEKKGPKKADRAAAPGAGISENDLKSLRDELVNF